MKNEIDGYECDEFEEDCDEFDYDNECCCRGRDPDYEYDRMRDDFLMIATEEDAKWCIESYPFAVRYLPEHYHYLLKVVKDK